MLVDSDSAYDPQAYVLRPDVVLRISEGIVKEEGPFNRIKAAARLSLEEIKKGYEEKKVRIKERELTWLDSLSSQLETIPDDEEKFLSEMLEEDYEKFDPKMYDYEA